MAGGSGKGTFLIHLGILGHEKARIQLKNNGNIKNVYYNDLLEDYLIVQEVNYNAQENKSDLILSTVNSSGKLIFEKRLDIPGRFVAMIQHDRAFWFFTHRSDENVIVLSKMDKETQEWQPQVVYNFESDFVNPTVIKNDDRSLTVLASMDGETLGMFYSIIDYEGSIRHEAIF